MYRFLQTINFGMEDNISQESLSPPSDKQMLPLPLTALRLLVPPLRLASAAIWQTVQRKVVADYGILEEFVSMVTDIIPELLTRHQRAQLTLGLRARLILALCHQENAPDCDLVEPHLDRMEMLIRSWLKEVGGSNPEVSHLDFVDLVKKFLSSPDEREHFFQVGLIDLFLGCGCCDHYCFIDLLNNASGSHYLGFSLKITMHRYQQPPTKPFFVLFVREKCFLFCSYLFLKIYTFCLSEGFP
ncbi:hypothetical protein GOODEAATRI_015374 [Goodea atripinnis]|uniref:TERF1-interacting nuclear factor 2 N-terminal domain-containing protein n=1 Tax=Goodea atripinnis TaxID=208336 RepID=A0ABV0NKI0_9TELE